MVERLLAGIILCLLLPLGIFGEESFRTFTTSSGKSFPFRVLSYEGQDFYFEDQSKKTIQGKL